MILRVKIKDARARQSQRGNEYVAVDFDVTGQPRFGPLMDVIGVNERTAWRIEEIGKALGWKGDMDVTPEALAARLRNSDTVELEVVVEWDRHPPAAYTPQLRVHHYIRIPAEVTDAEAR